MESRREREVKKNSYTFKFNTSYLKRDSKHKWKLWLKVVFFFKRNNNNERKNNHHMCLHEAEDLQKVALILQNL